MKRILAISMILALLMGCCTGTLAEESDGDKMSAASISENLQILVENGIVSQETLDAIVAYLEANPNEEGSGGEIPAKPDGQSDENIPEKPDGSSGNGAPEKPDGFAGNSAPEKPEGSSDNGAPEKPEGSSDNNAPEKPDGEPAGDERGMMLMLNQNQLDQLLENGIVTEDEYTAILALIEQSVPSGEPGGNDSRSVDYAGATEITEETELNGGEYVSTTADENAILIDTSANVSLNQITVSKSGDSDGGDNCNFYGVNAAILATGGTNVTISDATITTDADGANGVFSYGGNGGQNGASGDGTTVHITNTTITTTGNNAGGIMTTGGGVTNAVNLTIETSGRSSAAIRTDRGGGTVSVDGGSYTTNGLGSPAIYCTADISVSNAALVSNQSEGVCIEGKNNVSLTDCDLTVDNTNRNGNATFLDSIMIYQSMSGDADSGVSTFTMTGGNLTSKSGHVFHVTNTSAVISLNNVNITNEDAENVLLSVCDDGWNGAENIASLNASAQVLMGTILVGSNSALTLNLSDNSSFTGTFSGEIKNSEGTTVSTELGTVSVTLDSTSTWTLTGDAYITSFEGDAAQVHANGYTLYVNGEALEGTSD